MTLEPAHDHLAIREATAEDAEAISALVASLAPYFLADPDDSKAAAPFFESVSPEALRRYLTEGRYRYHVAESGGELVGVVGVRDGMHLFHLFVAEGFQRRGLAARLWSRARDAARAAGNPGRFTVNASLYAVPVYERFGFRLTGSEVRKDGVAYVPMELEDRFDSGGAGLELGLLADHPDDLPTVARWQYGEWGYLEEDDSVSRREARLRRHLQRHRLPLTLVARRGGELVGSADLERAELAEPAGPVAALSCVYVPEEHRAGGVGTALTRFAEETAEALGHRHLYLCTRRRRTFYERLGWEAVRTFHSHAEEVTVMRRGGRPAGGS